MSEGRDYVRAGKVGTWMQLLKTLGTFGVVRFCYVSCSLWIGSMAYFGHIFLCAV